MSTAICLRETVFDLDFNNRRIYAGEQHVAVNVKNKHRLETPLNRKYRRKVQQLDDAGRINVRASAPEYAYTKTQEDWWAWARELAHQHAVGPIHCYGRSGGWLILDHYTRRQLETLADEYNECHNCRDLFEIHVDYKCLFSSTRFKNDDTEVEKTFGLFQNLFQFISTIEASIPSTVADYRWHYYDFIDTKHAEHREYLKSLHEPRSITPVSTAVNEGTGLAQSI